jgi:hypothetical protein
MWRKLCLGVLKFVAGVAAASLAVELLFAFINATPLRWILPVPPVALYGPDPESGYRHRANVSGLWLTEHRSLVTTSNLGLRDRNRDLDHDGAPRAVVIGDSFVEALQVDQSETAVAVAERILSLEHPGTEVVNLGLAGARPAVEVARLQSEGHRLAADLDIVMLSVETLLSPSVMDDSEFTGYRRDASGELRLSYGFRDSRGYRFRTSLAGRVYYRLLDHSQLARIINARKNSGLFAEWFDQTAAAGERAQASFSCAPTLLDDQLALWSDGKPEEANALLHAFIRDLSAIRLSQGFPIIIATSGIEARCPLLEAKRSALVKAIRTRIEDGGLRFVDLDARVLAKTGPSGMARLRGFGAGIGNGHLNVEGNRVYGEVFADVIRTALAQH